MDGLRKKLVYGIGGIAVVVMSVISVQRMMSQILANPERTLGMWLTLATMAAIVLALWLTGAIRFLLRESKHQTRD